MQNIAFLRSINVGGRNIIKMKELSEELIKSGFSGVQTYIQSGNLIFNYKKVENKEITKILENLIRNKFNLNISAVVFNIDEIKQIIENNPYYTIDNKQIYITLFKSDNALIVPSEEILNQSGEGYTFQNNVFYIRCLQGYSDTKFNNGFFEKKYKLVSTTRNIGTIIKIFELATKK